MSRGSWCELANGFLPFEHGQCCLCLPFISLLTQYLLFRGVLASELRQILLVNLNLFSPMQIPILFTDFLSENLPFPLRTAHQFFTICIANPPLLVYIRIPHIDVEGVVTHSNFRSLFYFTH